jgi:uncharacterized membrane protein (UPF0127 family)
MNKFVKFLFGAMVLITSNAYADLDKVKIIIGSKVLIVESAETQEDEAQGLMNRKSLGQNEGMMFLFEEGSLPCFWMKNTLIPLSIAFVDRDNVIVKIEDMQPETENEHCSGKPVVFAIEVNQGWFKNNNINVGDKIDSISHVE